MAETPNVAQDKPLFYLAKSIDAMSKVDAVIFMKGWENARGCKIEHEIAVRYNKFIKELEEQHKKDCNAINVYINLK